MRLLKLIPDDTNIDFLRWRNVAMAFSMLLIAASIALIAVKGLNFGVDFAGGQVIRATFAQPPSLDTLRGQVVAASASAIRASRNSAAPREISIRLPLARRAARRAPTPPPRRSAAALAAGLSGRPHRRGRHRLGQGLGGAGPRRRARACCSRRSESPSTSGSRFEWQFGVGALFSLFHDVTLTLGFFALTQMEFDLNVVAALLTLIGYSLNDTIVIYDRVRENLRKYPQDGDRRRFSTCR